MLVVVIVSVLCGSMQGYYGQSILQMGRVVLPDTVESLLCHSSKMAYILIYHTFEVPPPWWVEKSAKKVIPHP